MLLTWKHTIGLSALAVSWYAFVAWGGAKPYIAFGAFGLLYLSGTLPASLVPPIFSFAYTAYCSKWLGRHAKHLLHPPASIPHTNFRNGCRLLAAPSNCNAQGTTGTGNFELAEFCRLCSGSNTAHGSDLEAILIVPTPILADNYAYLCFSMKTQSVVAIDPADASSVLRMIEHMSKLTGRVFHLTDVLCTHKHWDHAGGNEDLVNLARRANGPPMGAGELIDKNLRIFGSEIDAPVGATVLLRDLESSFDVGRGALKVRPVSSPGHTRGSLMFVVGAADASTADDVNRQRLALFTGDCVFCGGCGAMFEVRNINDVLTTYDAFHNDYLVSTDFSGTTIDSERVMVYVGHEYSEKLYDELCSTAHKMGWKANVRDAIMHEQRRVKSLRKLEQSVDGNVMLPHCTIPSNLKTERLVNPLLNLKRSALVNLRKRETRSRFFGINPSELEQLIYVSPDR